MREERRTITALSADVAGSTALAERLDPEDVRDVVGAAVRAMAETVEHFGGTVKDVAGDGVLALFGAPVAHEDDTERAVLAGLEIQRNVADHARRVLLDYAIESFGVRVGIEAGLAVTGPVGGGSHVEYGATGDVVNTAARLQSEARVGSVLVGPTARAQVRELFHWSDPTAVELRGKNQVLHVAEAAGPRGDAPRARRLPGRGAPLVGRQRELAMALRELDRLAGGVGVAVVIEGEAGIGKTRLLETLRERSRSGAAWLDATCTSLGSSTPYAPVAQLLASWGRSLAVAAARRIWCLPGATPPARRWPFSPATRHRRNGRASPRFRLQAANWRPRRPSPPSSDPRLENARS